LTLNLSMSAATGRLVVAIVFVLTVAASQAAKAQTYKVIYNFTGGADGQDPEAGLTMDKAGNLYGTTTGLYSYMGTAFKLSPKGSDWVFNLLYSFSGGSDGADPWARVIFGPDGSLYGTTHYGGGGPCRDIYGTGCGTVFNLRPPPRACTTALCPWSETVLYPFMAGSDGGYPLFGDLVFDQTGNLYGTTSYFGAGNAGTVYMLAPSNGIWMESVLYPFTGGNDGGVPAAGLIFDKAGNLYGTTAGGGSGGAGTVFQLTPSGSGWAENVLHSFQEASEGGFPNGGLIFDQSGTLYTLYGTTITGGPGGGGTVFSLTLSNGKWVYTLLYPFSGTSGNGGPWASLTMDPAGNLYGTTVNNGGYGSVFKLTKTGSTWAYKSLHDFTGGSDGGLPVSNVIMDAAGNLYGTASYGGTGSGCVPGCGVVWEITP
jgi:uncharacterized repeat protein (TIGR03803 family)